MSASTSDKITDVRNASRPNTARVTTARDIGVTNLACNDLSGWPTASKVHFVTYQLDTNSNPIAGTQLDCSGIVVSNTITNMEIIDGTDGGNSIGDVVEMLPTAAWAQDLADALTADHERTGAHKASITLTTPTITNPTITTPTIASFVNANHTHATAAQGGQITQAGLNLSKSNDAATYMVYDFGNFKLYRYRMAGSITVTNGQRNTWGTFPVPTGLAYTDVRPFSINYEGNYAGHAVVGLETGSASGWQCNLGNQYAGAPLTFTGYVHIMLITA